MAPESGLVAALLQIIRHLNQEHADYALAGGWAYSALVEPRATTDIDLLIMLPDASEETIGRLFSPLFDSVVPHSRPMRFQHLSIWRVVVIQHEQDIVVDLLMADSDFLRGALGRKQRIDFQGQTVPILTIEDLVLLKTLAGRLQDLADLEKIKQRQAELQVDWNYIEFWKGKLESRRPQ
jgi:hypothetical protein